MTSVRSRPAPHDRVAFVTGAAHGIGAAIDAGLAADSVAVVAEDLNLAGDAAVVVPGSPQTWAL